MKLLEEKEEIEEELEPETVNQWRHFGDYELVGNGQITNPDPNSPLQCGKFYGFVGCLHTELHDLVTLEGHNHKGEVYVKKRFHYCNNPRCPTCYRSGWAVREAKNIETRIKQLERRFGKAEHVIVSIPSTDYGLTFEQLRRKAVKVAERRKVHGGCLIFHAFRYRNLIEARRTGLPIVWYWSPHFHTLGFIRGDYAKCRKCKNLKTEGFVYDRSQCMACEGFEGRTRREFDKEAKKGGIGYIVKVKGERKTLFGTAWYQLNHASIKSNVKRFHVATWFGSCSYRKAKLPKEKPTEMELCPICGEPLVKLRYLGFDLKAILSQFWIKDFFTPLIEKETGNPLLVEKDSGSHRRFEYE
jgi:hypothetical protein